VDEVFGIKNSKIDVDEIIINPAKVVRALPNSPRAIATS
jgi:hypothetical protein